MRSFYEMMRFLCLLLLTTTLAWSRTPDWVKPYREKAEPHMKKGEWDQALVLFRKVTIALNTRNYIEAQQWLGWFYYHRGLAEYHLEDYRGAMKSFEIVYRKYGPRKNHR